MVVPRKAPFTDPAFVLALYSLLLGMVGFDVASHVAWESRPHEAWCLLIISPRAKNRLYMAPQVFPSQVISMNLQRSAMLCYHLLHVSWDGVFSQTSLPILIPVTLILARR